MALTATERSHLNRRKGWHQLRSWIGEEHRRLTHPVGVAAVKAVGLEEATPPFAHGRELAVRSQGNIVLITWLLEPEPLLVFPLAKWVQNFTSPSKVSSSLNWA